MDRASRGAKPEYPEATMRCFLHLRLHDFLVLTDALSHIRTDALYETRLTFLGAVQRTIRPSDRWILPVHQVRYKPCTKRCIVLFIGALAAMSGFLLNSASLSGNFAAGPDLRVF